MKYLIVGLGNIGEEYEDARHNIGFMMVDAIAQEKKCSWELKRHALKTDFKFKGRTIHMIKPTTFMNLSGKAANYWKNELNVPQENILVLVDDIALPFGKLRMRAKGSTAGHNGLASIQEQLGNNNYPRMKFGVDANFHKGFQADYVLESFNHEERKSLQEKIDKAGQMIYGFCTIGIGRTMTQYND